MSNSRSREEQIDDLMDHYEDPRHYGKLENPTVTIRMTNPGCGDIINLYAKIGPDGKLEDVSFEGEGCTISQAAASMAMEVVFGKDMDDIMNLPQDYMMEIVGNEIALTRPKCSTLGLNAVREAIREYIRKKHGMDTSDQDNQGESPKACPSH